MLFFSLRHQANEYISRLLDYIYACETVFLRSAQFFSVSIGVSLSRFCVMQIERRKKMDTNADSVT